MEITVVGTAHASARPERATVRATVTVEDATNAQDVVARVTAVAERLERDLAELAARPTNPLVGSTVSGVRTNTWQPYGPDGEGERRFGASATVTAEFRDVTALGETLAAWGRVDEIQLDGVEWHLAPSTRDTLEAKLLTDAVKEAQSRARIIAWSAGAADVTPVEIADPGLLSRSCAPAVPTGGYAARAVSATGAADALTVRADDLHLTVQVHARFQA